METDRIPFHVADLDVSLRQFLLQRIFQIGIAHRRAGQPVEIFRASFRDQRPRWSGPGKILNRIMNVENKGVRQFANIFEAALRQRAIVPRLPERDRREDQSREQRQHRDRRPPLPE